MKKEWNDIKRRWLYRLAAGRCGGKVLSTERERLILKSCRLKTSHFTRGDIQCFLCFWKLVWRDGSLEIGRAILMKQTEVDTRWTVQMRSLNSGAVFGTPNLSLLLFNAVCRGCLPLIVKGQGNVDFPPNRHESGCLAPEVARARALRGLRYNGIMAEAHPALVAVIIAGTHKNDGHAVACDGCGRSLITRAHACRAWQMLPCCEMGSVGSVAVAD